MVDSVTSLRFELRGRAGTVAVRFGRNDDPARWGYELLNLDYPVERAKGFPVVQADVTFPAEGYAAQMGWIQVARYSLHDTGRSEVVHDVPPQLRTSGSPYLSFGIRPSLFDAPSITNPEVTWQADSFLVHTPDALMTRTIHAICGFRWGYRVRGGMVDLVPPVPAEEADWTRNLPGLSERFPDWTFGSSWSTPNG